MSTRKKVFVTQRTYSAADISQYLGISLVSAYNLMHAHDFPAFFIGRRILVKREDFENWLERKQRRQA